jgi:murein DD-endopeptidase MepM/ murein hydrolase activator NlpD
MFVRSLTLFLGALLVCTSCSKEPSLAPVTLYGATEGAGSTGAHIVMEGDTLGDIAARYNIAPQDIAIYNNLPAPFNLRQGLRLKLPHAQDYKVRRFDNLYSVSRMFGVSTSEIARQNNLSPPYALEEGQVLKMPPLLRQQIAAPADYSSSYASPAESGVPAPVERVALAEPVAPRNWQAPPRSSSRFLRPVNGSVVSGYGPKDNGLHNDGINFGAPAGTPVLAAENGVIVYAGNELKGFGNLVLIKHGDGWVTAYAHMDSFGVQRGDTISRGQPIGSVGSTGSVDAPQLHFEIRRGTEAVDPQKYLDI